MKVAIVTFLITFLIMGGMASCFLLEWTQPRYHGETTVTNARALELIDNIGRNRIKIEELEENGTVTLRYDFFSPETFTYLETDSWEAFHFMAVSGACIIIFLAPLAAASANYRMFQEGQE